MSIFLHSNQLFQTITQSFYIVLSLINIRTRNKISAGVLITKEPRRKGAVGVRQAAAVIIIRMGPWKKLKNFRKNLTVPKSVAQCRK